MATRKQRLACRLEVERAERLVLRRLLKEGIAAYKNHVDGRGYDLIALDQATHRSALIQVECPSGTDASNRKRAKECDFIVFVGLHRGNRLKRSSGHGKPGPTFTVVPAKVAKRIVQDARGQTVGSRIGNLDKYEDAWALIRDFLSSSKGRYAWEGRVELGQKIVAVEVPVFPVVKLTFADGYQATMNFSRCLKRGPVFAPLRDPAFFKTAHPGAGGGSLEWIGPDGEEIDFCADALRMEAEDIWDPEKRVWKP